MGVSTYNPKKVSLTLGRHIASGLADDGFISIEPAGDGNSYVVGADGEVLVSVDPSSMYTVKVVVLQSSKTNAFLMSMYEKLKSGGDGFFGVTVKDLIGNEKFSGPTGWVTKPSVKGYGKAGTNREWEIVVADGKHS
ncbi:phage structural protein [Enterocloster bolteae]|uniref:phage structural protein n=1 Tax=Enterocloster bolteae TaxID=208479 RepID=UPI002A7F9F44|nr:phage protein [Enterocloster bolteae]